MTNESISLTSLEVLGKIIHPKILKGIIEDTGIPVEKFQ
jgi:hypothetical protein